METRVLTYKASPVGEEEVPSLVIEFVNEVPEFDDWLKDARSAYDTEAEKVVTAMGKAIPGGLFDAILVEMMRARVSLFRVPHFDKQSAE